MDGSGTPKFRLGESKYDQSTYYGRLRHFLDIVDPRTLTVRDKELHEAVSLLEDYKNGILPPGVTNSQLWEAQKIKQAILNQVSGEKIWMPFRMSGFVPFGTITVVGMLSPNPALKTVAFWQAMNQFHNAGVNFSNRNASTKVSRGDLAFSVAAATVTASGVAVYMHRVIKTKKFKAYQQNGRLVMACIPYVAVATANMVNLLCMRHQELTLGVNAYEEDGRLVGLSKACGTEAVQTTMITRALLPAPILLLPALIIASAERTALWKRFPIVRFPTQVAAIVGAFSVALPLTIALFPQTLKLETSKCETEIKLATRDHYVYFSRGI